MKKMFFSLALSAAMLVTTAAAATTASAAPAPRPVSESTQKVTSEKSFISQSCVEQVNAIVANKGGDASTLAQETCAGKLITTESDTRPATLSDVESAVQAGSLTKDAGRSLSQAVALSGVVTKDWTHTYWGGSLIEKHTGRTFYDGSNAWVASQGNGGYHVCHSEGSFAGGWAVTQNSCTNPGQGDWADAIYNFDASVAFKGSPVTLTIGLHYSVDKNGNVNAYQVGG